VSALIAIDWGTTAARAYVLDGAGTVTGTRSAPLGVQHVQDGRFADALSALLGDWRDDPAPRIACGMIGSRQGWLEAPYVACPAQLPDLVAGLVHVPGSRLTIVPGVRTRDANGVPDVMRGEETQIAGAIAARDARVLCTLPGTHSKWACVDAGRLVDFMSFMTGEMWDLLLRHSILGRLATPGSPAGGVGAAFERGVARGLGPGNLAHDAFGARTLALMGELAAEDVADWLSGLMIGREIRNARAWGQRHGYDGSRVRLVGADALVARYAAAMRHADIAVEVADSNAAARGLWRIATQAGIVSPSAAASGVPSA
jgi:2-dehydro-3-deoxygalactonokinase